VALWGHPMNHHFPYLPTAPSPHLFRGEGWGGVLETYPPLTPPAKKQRGEDRWWVQEVGGVVGTSYEPSLPLPTNGSLPASFRRGGLGRGSESLAFKVASL
jgi:hypothetical protein